MTNYELQLHHLTPSGVLHLSCFVTLCECFLGVLPHFNLFRYLFEVVPLLKEGNVPACGGAVIRPRPDSGYFELAAASKPESWEWRCFYSPDAPSDYRDTGLPVFANVPCWQRPEWSSKMDFSPETN